MTMRWFRVEKRTQTVVSTFVKVRAHSAEEAVEEARNGIGEPDTLEPQLRSMSAKEPVTGEPEYEAVDIAEERAREAAEDEEEKGRKRRAQAARDQQSRDRAR